MRSNSASLGMGDNDGMSSGNISLALFISLEMASLSPKPIIRLLLYHVTDKVDKKISK